jgi:hypothetical protein
VLLVIFEARPEVIVNIAALALKSGALHIPDYPSFPPFFLFHPLHTKAHKMMMTYLANELTRRNA